MQDDQPVSNDQDNPAVGPTPPGHGPVSPSNFTPPPPPAASQPQTFSIPASTQNKPRRKLGRKGILVLVLTLLLGGSAAAYFGFVVPNQPENVWEKALANTADGYDGLVKYVDEQKDIKGYKAKGNMRFEGAIAGDGNIEASNYDGNGKFKMDMGFAGSRYNIEALTLKPSGAKSPDLYFRVDGIKGIGSVLGAAPTYRQLGNQISKLDNEWIFVDHTLFDQLSTTSATSGPLLNREDALGIARAIGEVNREYLFSSDSSRRVLKVVQKVGREDRDGRSTYHFVVSYDKENLKKYMSALKEKLRGTKLKELMEASGQSYDKVFDLESINKNIDKMKGDETADVWVDMKTKLIRYVRFYDKTNKDDYVELGMPFNGGDEIPFSVFFNTSGKPNSPKQKITVTFSVNTKTDKSKLTLAGEFERDGQKQKVDANLDVEPNNEPIDVKKPAGAVPIMEIIGALMTGFYGGAAPNRPVTPAPGADPLLRL